MWASTHLQPTRKTINLTTIFLTTRIVVTDMIRIYVSRKTVQTNIYISYIYQTQFFLVMSSVQIFQYIFLDLYFHPIYLFFTVIYLSYYPFLKFRLVILNHRKNIWKRICIKDKGILYKKFIKDPVIPLYRGWHPNK